VDTTSTKREQIAANLRDKERRELFVDEQIDTGLPFQIRAIRQARDWSQTTLSERAGMAQGAISRLESLSYGKYTLTTLKRLAAAFDVGLVVRFEPFSELVDWESNLSPEDLAVPEYDRDPGLHPTPDVEETAHRYRTEAFTAFDNVVKNPEISRSIVIDAGDHNVRVMKLVLLHGAGHDGATISEGGSLRVMG